MVSEIDQGLHAPTKIPKDIKMVKEDAAPPPQMAGVAGMSGMGGSAGGVLGGVMGGVGTGPPVVVRCSRPSRPGRSAVSSRNHGGLSHLAASTRCILRSRRLRMCRVR